MDDNLKREIEYLTCLIKQHKQKVYQRPNKSKLVFHNTNITAKPVIADKCAVHKEQRQVIDLTQETSDIKLPKPSVKVHVNPNFKAHNPVIHINPKIRAKPLIHLNPKVIKDMPCASQKPYEKPQELAQDVKRSVYVNPELMKTLKAKEKSKTVANSPSSLKLKSAKTTESTKTPVRRHSNSGIIVLSKRKLVRIRRSPKNPTVAGIMTPMKVKRLTQSQRVFKKIRAISKEIPVTPKTCKSTVLQGQGAKFEISKYKIDRTTVQKAKAKKNENFQQKTVAKSTNKKMEFVTIGGVVYKSTRNQLIRKSLPMKRKSTANTSNDKFLIAANGKRLQRLKIRKENTSINGAKILTTVNPKLSSKTIISNKVKQRSIQILRNKMRKNNQPCLLYQKFGFCAGHKKGTCPKLHDKRQVSLCKRFLQGQCLLDNCPLSHDVGPEKMPTCKYFLEGCCTRDSCPYLHVKVSSKTSVCIEFLKGYCAKGNECKLRHENVCPEFDKTGECGKGKYCPYPHKTQNTGDRRGVKYFKRKRKPVRRAENTKKQEEKQEQESRLRYYEKPEDLSQDLGKKKDSIIRKIQIMKNVQCNSEQNYLPEVEDSESNIIRPPIGILPAYIPID